MFALLFNEALLRSNKWCPPLPAKLKIDGFHCFYCVFLKEIESILHKHINKLEIKINIEIHYHLPIATIGIAFQ